MRVRAVVGGQEVLAECRAEFAPIVERLLLQMHDQAGLGASVFEGTTIRFGWTTFTIKRRLGKLALHEPDFARSPESRLRHDVSCSIEVHLRQQGVLADLGLTEGEPAGCFEEIVVAHRSLAEPKLIARRLADPRGASAWFVFRAGQDAPLTLESLPGQYGKLPVWRLLRERPSLLPYLALPVGFTVLLDAAAPTKILSPDGEVWS